MVSTSKIAFNIDGQIVLSTLNTPIQQRLANTLIVWLDFKNKLTYQYAQVQLIVIDEISHMCWNV